MGSLEGVANINCLVASREVIFRAMLTFGPLVQSGSLATI